ncbi:MAG: orotate phosphoribosyltransferase [Planctomycetota bacterium]
MEDFKRRFVDFLMDCGAFKLGSFTLKSGRVSPTFLNTGLIRDGKGIQRLGEAYASSLLSAVGADGFDCVFGPAYKGVPIAVATTIALANKGVVKGYLFDRKEAKDRGEEAAAGAAAKVIVGHRPEAGERIVIVDDVMTTGATKYEAVELLGGLVPDASFPGLAIALDRQETGADGIHAGEKFTSDTGVPVVPTVTMVEVLTHLEDTDRLPTDDREACRKYLTEYGTEAAKAWAS